MRRRIENESETLTFETAREYTATVTHEMAERTAQLSTRDRNCNNSRDLYQSLKLTDLMDKIIQNARTISQRDHENLSTEHCTYRYPRSHKT